MVSFSICFYLCAATGLALLASLPAASAFSSFHHHAVVTAVKTKAPTPSALRHFSGTHAIRMTPATISTFMGKTSSSDNESSTTTSTNSRLDYGDIAKYIFATGIEAGLIGGALKLIDRLCLSVPVLSTGTLPAPVVGILFCFLSLRSRVASVLDNSRPNREAQKGKATPLDVKRPSWTPPGIAFPFIWLTITVLRGVSSALVYQQTGALCCGPLLAMVLHLSIGDTWNTITNIEKRLGVSAVGCMVVWASVMNVIFRYFQVSPMAGRILAPSGVWISIATVLTWQIWRINKPIQPAWPVKGGGKSSAFKWSNLGQLQATSIGGSSSKETE